jgi:hypothetical protein
VEGAEAAGYRPCPRRPGGQYLGAPTASSHPPCGTHEAFNVRAADQAPLRPLQGLDLLGWARKLYLRWEGLWEGDKPPQPWPHKGDRAGWLRPAEDQ